MRPNGPAIRFSRATCRTVGPLARRESTGRRFLARWTRLLERMARWAETHGTRPVGPKHMECGPMGWGPKRGCEHGPTGRRFAIPAQGASNSNSLGQRPRNLASPRSPRPNGPAIRLTRAACRTVGPLARRESRGRRFLARWTRLLERMARWAETHWTRPDRPELQRRCRWTPLSVAWYILLTFSYANWAEHPNAILIERKTPCHSLCLRCGST